MGVLMDAISNSLAGMQSAINRVSASAQKIAASDPNTFQEAFYRQTGHA